MKNPSNWSCEPVWPLDVQHEGLQEIIGLQRLDEVGHLLEALVQRRMELTSSMYSVVAAVGQNTASPSGPRLMRFAFHLDHDAHFLALEMPMKGSRRMESGGSLRPSLGRSGTGFLPFETEQHDQRSCPCRRAGTTMGRSRPQLRNSWGVAGADMMSSPTGRLGG